MRDSSACLKCLVLYLALLISGSVHAAEFRVTFINPAGESGFWGDVSGTMTAAAKDLNVELEILNAERDPVLMERLLRERLGEGDLPDYFVIVNEYQSAARMMQLFEDKNSKVFFLLNALTPSQVQSLEKLGVHLDNVVGSVVPDNEAAGHAMAKALIEAVRVRKQEQKNIRMFALSGDSSTPAGVQREAGMLRAVAEADDVDLVRVIPVNWNEETAYRKARELLSHSRFDAVWAANDAIAIGAQRAATEMGHMPGHNMSFVGLNWSLRGMHEVRKGTLTMTHGGHFLAGAWAIVILNDHFKGNFSDDTPVDVHFKMSPIVPDNVELYLERLGDRNWDKIDFASFSKSKTGPSDYDFSATAVLEAVASGK